MQAGSKTAKEIKAITDVMSQAQTVTGMRASVIPAVRKSSVVVMKFTDPRSCAIQKMAIESPHNVWPRPSPGPASLPTALSGG